MTLELLLKYIQILCSAGGNTSAVLRKTVSAFLFSQVKINCWREWCVKRYHLW